MPPSQTTIDSPDVANADSQPGITPPNETVDLELSPEQRKTIQKYAELSAHLAKRLSARSDDAKCVKLTLDELDDLVDPLQVAVYRAHGNERQKVLRIIAKTKKLLGAEIDPSDILRNRSPNAANTVYQIKIKLLGFYPPIWRRIQTKDCSLAALHGLIQIAMGWECAHSYG